MKEKKKKVERQEYHERSATRRQIWLIDRATVSSLYRQGRGPSQFRWITTTIYSTSPRDFIDNDFVTLFYFILAVNKLPNCTFHFDNLLYCFIICIQPST